MLRPRTRLLWAALVFALAVAGCSSKGSGHAVAVTATDRECRVAQTQLQAGKRSFKVTNEGSKVTEVYVYAQGDRVVTEKEDIGPGTSATFSVDLAAGTYQVACKPGQTGDGIRQTITVTGSGGAAAPAAERQVAVRAVDYDFGGLDGFTARAGQTVELVMRNDGQAPHELEVLAPDGRTLGEISPVQPGAEGRATVTLASRGTYRYVCRVGDHEQRGMEGRFTVT